MDANVKNIYITQESCNISTHKNKPTNSPNKHNEKSLGISKENSFID